VDKCHLNGLALREGRPRYVTILAETDEPLGWRPHKADGGMIMDIETNEILVRGLSMPHSPRWHKGRLWFLESGRGAICQYDPATKKVREIGKVPGFTRGLYLVDDVAFVGISKVRESATFSGLPVTRLPKRICGVWVVDLSTGKELTHIEFTTGVDEIFSVALLPHAVTEITDFQSPLSRSNYMVPDTGLGNVKMPETPVEMAAPHFEKGNDLFNEGRKEAAIAHFKKALEIQPDFLPATFNMAIALGDLNRFDQAKRILMEVVEKDAAIVETYNSLGYVYYKKGDLAAAKAHFEKALALKPDYTQARTSLDIVMGEMA
jgi:tetratricopeptide (TPR) repeat protein